MSPAQTTARLNEALAYHNAGRAGEAESVLRQLGLSANKLPKAQELWGKLAEKEGRAEDAVRHFEEACRLDPTAVKTAILLARALIACGRIDDAAAALACTTKQFPRNHEAWNALGFVMKLKGRAADAIAFQQKAVELAPRYAEGWCQLGFTLSAIGRSNLALVPFDRAIALEPTNATARYGRAQALHKLYRRDEALADYEAVLSAEPLNHEARSLRLFALQNSDTITRDELFREHVAYGQSVGPGPEMLEGYAMVPDRRLRVAILSPDLRSHSCAFFLEPLLVRCPSESFEVFLYHDYFTEDETTDRLKRSSACFRNFIGQSQAAVERVIRSDRPDVIVDLTGHIGTTVRLPILAKRLAPVQITYLGYPDTTGVAAMDFRFTDPVADPPGDADAFATEELMRFSRVAWAYAPPVDAPPVAASPCLKQQPFTFGCFNSPTKFTSSLLAAWAEILNALPDARLLLKGKDLDMPEVRDHIVRWLALDGVPVDRVEILPLASRIADHLNQYARMDVALDTFPYNGTTTTCEALWMGRPVVTIRGDRHAARVGASLLTAVGHPEWIAGSRDDYVRIAVAMARAGKSVAETSARLRSDMRESDLLDHTAQAERFWTAVRQCWRSRCGANRTES